MLGNMWRLGMVSSDHADLKEAKSILPISFNQAVAKSYVSLRIGGLGLHGRTRFNVVVGNG